MVPEAPAALPDRRPADVHRLATVELDASVGAPPDGAADEGHRGLADGAAEKWADPVPDGLARDAMPSEDAMQLELLVAPASAAEPCRPAAVQFAERSCAAAGRLVALAGSEPLTLALPGGPRSPQAVPLARKSQAPWPSARAGAELPAVEALLPEVQPQLAAYSSPLVEHEAQQELPVA